MFRFWDCCVSKCTAAAVIDIGNCEHCLKHYCVLHVSSPTHSCEVSTFQRNELLFRHLLILESTDPLDDDSWTITQTQELQSLRAKINDQALLKRASELNGGIHCTLDPSDPLGRSLMGGMHVHLRLQFSDGTTWLARIPRQNYISFSDDFSARITESECATLRWLERIDVPSLRLYGLGLQNDPGNEVSVASMLIDELPDTALLLKQPFASSEQLRKVYDQWSGILCTLHKYPFEKIGSLVLGSQPNGDVISVGPIVGDRTGTFPQMGPFQNAKEYYSTFAEKYLEMIFDGQLFSAYPVKAYLIFKYLQKLAESGRWNAFEAGLDNGPFFLKHMDDKGDHILVDDDYNITGIIDWTFARAVPAFEAFGPSLLTADLDDLFNGKAGRSLMDNIMTEALQSCATTTHLGRMMDGPDLVRRFSFGLGMGMNLSWDEASSLFKGVISTATGIDLREMDWEVWYQNRLHEWADDSRLQTLLLREGHSDTYQTAIKDVQLHHQTPRFSACSIDNCTRAGVRGRSCARCWKHLCAKHLSRKHHSCLSSHEVRHISPSI